MAHAHASMHLQQLINITCTCILPQAAWSLVLSKDPRIKPAPRPPCSAGCLDSSTGKPHDTVSTTAARSSVVGLGQNSSSQPAEGNPKAALGQQQQFQPVTGLADVAARQTTADLPSDLLLGQKSAKGGEDLYCKQQTVIFLG